GVRASSALPLTDARVAGLEFHQPAAESQEMRYLHARRTELGGYLPARIADGEALEVPAATAFAAMLERAPGREQSTTTVFVTLLSHLLRDANLGKRIVPIVADQARTFWITGLFRQTCELS